MAEKTVLKVVAVKRFEGWLHPGGRRVPGFVLPEHC